MSDEYLQQGNWQQSLVEARRAESVLASGDAGHHLHRRVAERLADLRFVMRLEEFRIAVPENAVSWDAVVADEAYTRLFRDYGIDVQKSDIATVGKQMRERTIHVQLALALDNWALKLKAAERKRLLAIARVADPDEVRCRVRDALERLDRRSLLELAQVPETAKNSAATVALLASGLMTVHETDSAAELLRRGQNHYRDDFRINFSLANTHLFSQSPPQLDDAIRFYQAALAVRPNSPGTLNNMALALMEKGELDEAVEAFRESIHRQPHWGPAHSNLAHALLAQGKPNEALASFKNALELGYNGFLPEAIATFRKAVERDPKDAEAHCNLGAMLHAQGKFEEAIGCFRRALELNPKYALAHANLGKVLGDQGKFEDSIAAFDKAHEFGADNASFLHNRGNVLCQAGRMREAIADFDKATELDPGDHWLWYQAAALYLYTGDVDRYRDACRALLDLADKLSAEQPEIAERTAKTCALAPDSAPDFSRVQRLAERTVTGTEEHYLRRFFTLGKGLTDYRGGHYAQAIEWLERYAPRAEGTHWDASAFAGLAMAHHRLGHTDQARASLDLARAIMARRPQDWLRSSNLHDWMHCEILCREAEQVLVK